MCYNSWCIWYMHVWGQSLPAKKTWYSLRIPTVGGDGEPGEERQWVFILLCIARLPTQISICVTAFVLTFTNFVLCWAVQWSPCSINLTSLFWRHVVSHVHVHPLIILTSYCTHAQWYVCLVCVVSIDPLGVTSSVHNPSAIRRTLHLFCHSQHPASHKRAVVRTLMCRVEALLSGAQEEKLVSQALQGNGYPKGFIHIRLPAAWSADHMTVRPVNLWLFPTSVDCLNPSVGSYPSSHLGHFSSLLNPPVGASALQKPCTSKAQKGISVQYLVLNASAPTLAKQADPWTVTFENITGLWRMEI